MNTVLVYVYLNMSTKSNARYHKCDIVTLANDNGILPRVYESEPEFCSSTTGAE